VLSIGYLRGDPRLSSMPNTVVAVPGMHILPRVLVIAEDRFAQRSPQRLIESGGYDVAGAANEAAGLESLRDAPPLQSSWIFIEGRAVRDGMSFGKSGKASARSQSLYWAPCWSQTQLCS
jgi:hypothetical protein